MNSPAETSPGWVAITDDPKFVPEDGGYYSTCDPASPYLAWTFEGDSDKPLEKPRDPSLVVQQKDGKLILN